MFLRLLFGQPFPDPRHRVSALGFHPKLVPLFSKLRHREDVRLPEIVRLRESDNPLDFLDCLSVCLPEKSALGYPLFLPFLSETLNDRGLGIVLEHEVDQELHEPDIRRIRLRRIFLSLLLLSYLLGTS